MTASQPMPVVPGITFIRYDLTHIGSISHLFATLPRCGIYVLEFEDGTRYGGQAVNVVNRFSNHVRDWRPLRIVGLQFAAVDRSHLNHYEQTTVTWLESRYSVRNKMLTGRPRGDGDVVIEVEEGRSAIVPWDRDSRTVVDEPTVLGRRKRRDPKYKQYTALKRHPEYPRLVDVLAQYVHETIPDPIQTQHAWSLTAMPGTNSGTHWARPFTLNIGSMETLYSWQDRTTWSVEPPSFNVNVRPTDDFRNLLKQVRSLENVMVRYGKTGYRRAYEVCSLEVRGVDALAALLRYDFVLDAAYKLNASLLREGSRMHSRHHNVYFAADVLNGIANRPADQLVPPIDLLPLAPLWRRVIRLPRFRGR